MAEFIRPAARAHWFDKEDDMEWGICGPDGEPPVDYDPDVRLIPHLDPSDPGVLPATRTEALRFWLAGGWDEC